MFFTPNVNIYAFSCDLDAIYSTFMEIDKKEAEQYKLTFVETNDSPTNIEKLFSFLLVCTLKKYFSLSLDWDVLKITSNHIGAVNAHVAALASQQAQSSISVTSRNKAGCVIEKTFAASDSENHVCEKWKQLPTIFHRFVTTGSAAKCHTTHGRTLYFFTDLSKHFDYLLKYGIDLTAAVIVPDTLMDKIFNSIDAIDDADLDSVVTISYTEFELVQGFGAEKKLPQC